ncbi:hypothetical protein WMY93_003264 [Mugilogobius chulae]|uniref:C1q domain-containing protein n=1 Tax=Mugilogobius chulae TaxID=88201 RepID=A0AAW0PW45_9GOBI
MQSAVLLLLIGCALSETHDGFEDRRVKNKNSRCCYSLAKSVGSLKWKVAKLQLQVNQLKKKTQGAPKVAFSATLYTGSNRGNTGPFKTATPLKYKAVHSNLGGNYNPNTGIFTARVRGLYFFRFSMFNSVSNPPNSAVSLMKNGQRVVSVWDNGKDNNDMGSNAAVLPLQVGDKVYVELIAGKLIYDDATHYNSFAGFLLYAL